MTTSTWADMAEIPACADSPFRFISASMDEAACKEEMRPVKQQLVSIQIYPGNLRGGN